MADKFVDNRYLTDMLSIVLGYDSETIKELTPEQQVSVFQSLQCARDEFNSTKGTVG